MTRETFDLYTLTLTSVPARALHRVRGGQRPLSDFVFLWGGCAHWSACKRSFWALMSSPRLITH